MGVPMANVVENVHAVRIGMNSILHCVFDGLCLIVAIVLRANYLEEINRRKKLEREVNQLNSDKDVLFSENMRLLNKITFIERKNRYWN